MTNALSARGFSSSRLCLCGAEHEFELTINYFYLLQIGALDDYYLFQHHRVSKRSLRSSRKHHSALKSEFEVSVDSQRTP